MKTLLWMIFLVGAYMWVMTSGHDQVVIEKGRAFYRFLAAWFDDAEIDFQAVYCGPPRTQLEAARLICPESSQSKKRCRRWD